MKHLLILGTAATLAACGGDRAVADNADVPANLATSDRPGDWSALAGAVGRRPAESGLLQDSPVSIDLQSLLGPDLPAFRSAMGVGSALAPESGVLVSIGDRRTAYLILVPGDHALEAGIKRDGRWKRFGTPGAEVPVPPSVAALLRS